MYSKKHGLFATGGSDFHTFNDEKHSNIGDAEYYSPYVEEFLNRLNEK